MPVYLIVRAGYEPRRVWSCETPSVKLGMPQAKVTLTECLDRRGVCDGWRSGIGRDSVGPIRGDVRPVFFNIKPVLSGLGAARSGVWGASDMPDFVLGRRGGQPCCQSRRTRGHPIESNVAPETQAWNRPGCAPVARSAEATHNAASAEEPEKVWQRPRVFS